MRRLFWPIVSFGAVITIWKLVANSGFIPPALFPPPEQVATAFWRLATSGVIFGDLQDSLLRVGAGLLLGVVSGISIGVLTGRSKDFEAATTPLIQLARALPPVAIIPLVIIWLGIGNTAKIFSIAFAAFFPVWLNTYLGTRHIALEYVWSARLLTQSSSKILTQVILAGALPFITTGIRIAIAISFVMVFVSELAGASSGLGYRISITQLAYRVDEMMAVLLILAALAAALDQLFVFAARKLFPWLTLASSR